MLLLFINMSHHILDSLGPFILSLPWLFVSCFVCFPVHHASRKVLHKERKSTKEVDTVR